MERFRVVDITHPDILSVYTEILALNESSKNDAVPFDSNIIMKLLYSFNDHLTSIAPRTMRAPDFKNMLYTLVEEQVSSGFVISASLRKVIDDHRVTMDKNPMSLNLQKFLIHSAKME
jgi:hypothetical protein